MGVTATGITKVKDEAAATALVLDWFEQHHKPATPQSLTDALGSRVAKPLVQRLLEQLHATDRLHVKDMKKIRFYYLRLPTPADAPADAAAVEAVGVAAQVDGGADAVQGGDRSDGIDEPCEGDAAAELRREVAAAAVRLAECHHRRSRWHAWPSAAERAARRAALEAALSQLTADVTRMQTQQGGAATSAPHSAPWLPRVRRAVQRYRRARRAWAERKAWATRLLEASAGELNTPARAAEALGCTTDADAAVSFAETAVALPPSLLRECGL